jgi:hypothetical protein
MNGYYINKQLKMICYGKANQLGLVDATVVLSDFRFGFGLGYHYDRWNDIEFVCSEDILDSSKSFLDYINSATTDQLINFYLLKEYTKLAKKNSKSVDDYSNCLIANDKLIQEFGN